MKVFAVTLSVFMNAALCRGQTDTFQQAFEVLRARDNVEGAIAALSSGSGDVQPPCAHPTGNCKFRTSLF